MNRKKTFILVILVWGFLLSLQSISAEENKYYSTYGYEQLTSKKEKKLYRALEKKMNQFQNSSKNLSEKDDYIGFDYKIPEELQLSKETTLDLWEMLQNMHPEYFWAHYISYYSSPDAKGQTKLVTRILLHCYPDYANGEERQKLWTSIQEEIEHNYMSLINEEMPDYEKEYRMHNELIKRIRYSKIGDDIIAETWSQNIVGVFTDMHISVCAGYAKAFQLLMNRCEVECFYVSGYILDETTNEKGAHAWNVICLNNEWYNVDVTWDDTDEGNGETIPRYDYFNFTDSADPSRTLEETIYSVPSCDSTTYCFANVKQLLINSGTITAEELPDNDTTEDWEPTGLLKKLFDFIASWFLFLPPYFHI